MAGWRRGDVLACHRRRAGHPGRSRPWQDRVIGDGSLNLLSPRTRDGLAKKLEHKVPDVPWEDHLDVACRAMVTRRREGEPVEELQARPRSGSLSLIEPVLPEHETSTFYAGGEGSRVVLTCAERSTQRCDSGDLGDLGACGEFQKATTRQGVGGGVNEFTALLPAASGAVRQYAGAPWPTAVECPAASRDP